MLLILIWGGNSLCLHTPDNKHLHWGCIWLLKLCPHYFRRGGFVCQQFNTWRLRETLGFSENGFSWDDSSNIQGENGRRNTSRHHSYNLSVLVTSAHFEPPARLSKNTAATRRVCLHDQNKYELHTNKSRQLPCYSTEVVYWENMLLIQVYVNSKAPILLVEQDCGLRWLWLNKNSFLYICAWINHFLSDLLSSDYWKPFPMCCSSVQMISQGLMFRWCTRLFVSMFKFSLFV